MRGVHMPLLSSVCQPMKHVVPDCDLDHLHLMKRTKGIEEHKFRIPSTAHSGWRTGRGVTLLVLFSQRSTHSPTRCKQEPCKRKRNF